MPGDDDHNRVPHEHDGTASSHDDNNRSGSHDDNNNGPGSYDDDHDGSYYDNDVDGADRPTPVHTTTNYTCPDVSADHDGTAPGSDPRCCRVGPTSSTGGAIGSCDDQT
jgi:hypothetical protein